MHTWADRRLVAGILLAGAALSLIGNALHPIIPPGEGTEGFLQTIEATGYWEVLHLVIAVAVVLITAGIVLLARWLAATEGGGLAWLAAVTALIGGSIFVLQIGAVDGVVLAGLGEEVAVADNPESVLAVADAFAMLDSALLSLSVLLFIGAPFLALGLAFQRAGALSPWLRWVAIAAGAIGIVVGALMFLDIAEVLTAYAFRVVALANTVVTIGVGIELYRGTALGTAESEATAVPG